MPEVPLFCSRHLIYLGSHQLYSLQIFFFSCDVIKLKQVFCRIYIVEVFFFSIIISDTSILIYKSAYKIIRKLQIFFLPGDLVKPQDTCYHTAIYIIPSILFTFSNELQIPGRMPGIRMSHKIIQVIIKKLFCSFPATCEVV